MRDEDDDDDYEEEENYEYGSRTAVIILAGAVSLPPESSC
jgi:hypothetical protein